MVRRVTWADFRNYWVNEGIKALWIAIWIGANLVAFFYTFYQYWKVRLDIFAVLGFRY